MTRRTALFICLVALLFSCVQQEEAMYSDAILDAGRSVRRVVRDQGGVPIMELHLEYLGKSPKGPMPELAPSTWKEHDTDFYNIHLINLTDQEIELLEWQYVSDDVLTSGDREVKRPPTVLNQKGIERLLGAYIIKPMGELVQRNSFKWSDKPYSKTVKTIKLRYEGGVYETRFDQVYKR